MRMRAPEASRANTSASEQRLEEALVGPGLLAGERGGLLEPLEHPWRLQLREQVRQPLPSLRLGRAHAHSSA